MALLPGADLALPGVGQGAEAGVDRPVFTELLVIRDREAVGCGGEEERVGQPGGELTAAGDVLAVELAQDAAVAGLHGQAADVDLLGPAGVEAVEEQGAALDFYFVHQGLSGCATAAQVEW